MIVTLLPATSVSVAAELSATTLLWPETAIVRNARVALLSNVLQSVAERYPSVIALALLMPMVPVVVIVPPVSGDSAVTEVTVPEYCSV